MAQKIAPPSLRLNINRHFQACWFSDRKYGKILHQNLKSDKFLRTIFEFLGTRTAISHYQPTAKALMIHSFFCDPRIFDERLSRKSYPLELKNAFQKYSESFEKEKNQRKLKTGYSWFLFNQTKLWSPFKKYIALKLCMFQLYQERQRLKKSCRLPFSVLGSVVNQAHVRDSVNTPAINFYHQHIQTVLSTYSNTPVIWEVKKVQSIFKSAEFLAHHIALCFEQNQPFRQIFRRIFKDVKKESMITGLRIACAGRLNGAEMARVESKLYGQTSLHVFSNRIDYKAATAYTSFGLIGIKVWISFRK